MGYRFLVILALLGALSACNTVAGVGEDVSAAGGAVSGAADDTSEAISDAADDAEEGAEEVEEEIKN